MSSLPRKEISGEEEKRILRFYTKNVAGAKAIICLATASKVVSNQDNIIKPQHT